MDTAPALRRPALFTLTIGILAALLSTLPAQARAAAPPFSLKRVAGGFNEPVFVGAPRGDGRLFVVERAGRVRVRTGGATRTFLDIRSMVTAAGGEQGLLSIAFHPNFRSNGRYFAYYTRRSDGEGVVAEFRARGNGTVRGSRRQVLVVPLLPGAGNHNGGMIAFGNDGLLYIGTGDGGGGGDPRNSGQDLGALRGKVLRIGVDGAKPYVVPASNPFVDRAGARKEIFALGLRNPWRLSFDRPTGDLYIGDVGQGEREEVDRLTGPRPAGGANFGWGRFEGTGVFNSGVALASGTSHTLPVFQYSHARGCSITGGYVYRGRQVPALRGYYLFADFCTKEIRGFVGDGRKAFHKPVKVGSVSTFGMGGDGNLYVASLDDGAVYRFAR